MRTGRFYWLALVVLLVAGPAHAFSITIHTPANLTVDKAIAIAKTEPKTRLAGSISNQTIIFADPIPGSAYEVQLTLRDGTVLQGVDMGWYSRVPNKADAGPITDDDRQQMTAVFEAGAQFFNVQQCVILAGNHNRAVMMVRLERNNGFHSDKGDEIIWRPELWYFENHHGGWEKVPQTDRVLRRERFASPAAYHVVMDHLRWVAELGGLKCTPAKPDMTITLPLNAGVPTNPPGTQPASPTGDAAQH